MHINPRFRKKNYNKLDANLDTLTQLRKGLLRPWHLNGDMSPRCSGILQEKKLQQCPNNFIKCKIVIEIWLPLV